jgi:hypothetical protein
MLQDLRQLAGAEFAGAARPVGEGGQSDSGFVLERLIRHV